MKQESCIRHATQSRCRMNDTLDHSIIASCIRDAPDLEWHWFALFMAKNALAQDWMTCQAPTLHMKDNTSAMHLPFAAVSILQQTACRI